MRYQDYIEYMDSDDVCIHINNGILLEKEVTRPILLISHNLSVTGAPLALLDAARILVKNSYQVFLVSFLGEDILDDYLKLGCVALLYSGKTISTVCLKKMADIFPVILVNTLGLVPLVNFFVSANREVFWWIHEGNYYFENLNYDCSAILHASSLHILAASPKVSRAVTDHFNRSSQTLNVMVNDCYTPGETWKTDETIHFLWAGVINSNKMPELLLQAVRELPETYQKRADFTFCGDGVDAGRKEMIRKYTENFSNILYLPAMPHQQLMEYIKNTDVIVVCSKEETTSLVAAEGFMMEKTVICSDGCGITDFLKDGIDSFLFSAGDHRELGKKIRYVLDHFEELAPVRRRGRDVYERYYTETVFEKTLLQIFG